MSFFESSFLWLDALIASTALALALSMIGVYSSLRRVVFLPAALSSLSGFGALATVYIFALLNVEVHDASEAPWLISTGVTLLGALILGLMKTHNSSREMVIGIVYIAASSLIILIGDRMPAESVHLDEILFGNAVIVERGRMWTAVGVSIFVMIVHVVFARVFLFVSADPDTASANGIPVRLVDGLLFVTLGLAISVATRTIGALPVFAYTAVPGAAALLLFHRPWVILLSAAAAGGFAAVFGYWISFELSFPTGACTAFVSVVLLMAALAVKRLKGR